MSKRRPDPTSPAPGGLPDYAQDLQRASEGARGRLPSNLRRAEEALYRAEEHHRLGDEDELTGAQILSFQASLRNTQGRFEEAAQLLDRALAIYRDAKAGHLEGRTLIQKATTLG